VKVYKVVYKGKRLHSASMWGLKQAGWNVEYIPHQWTRCPNGGKLFAFRLLEEAIRFANYMVRPYRKFISYEVWEAEAEGVVPVKKVLHCLKKEDLKAYWEMFYERGYLPHNHQNAPSGTVAADQIRLDKCVYCTTDDQ